VSRASRLAAAITVVAAVSCLPARAAAQEPVALRLSPERAAERDWNLRMQLAGHTLLGVGSGVVLVGVSLVAATGWGDVGKAGFGCVGAGLAVGVTGMFLLGFSHPVHDILLRSHVALAPIPGGAALALTRDF
jgi:hypothetical protein